MNYTSIKRIFVYGFPHPYGGAGTELAHQIRVWQHMGVEVHLIPSWGTLEPICTELIRSGVIIHEKDEWSVLTPEDPILCMCNPYFLDLMPEIRRHTRRTIWMNCMSWLFDSQEKKAMEQGHVALYLYQNETVRQDHMSVLRPLHASPDIYFQTVAPYFYEEEFPFVADRSEAIFCCGHISRASHDKYARNTLLIYDGVASPVPKCGLFLGFNEECEKKIGTPAPWIRVARNHNTLSPQDFYKQCHVVLQPTSTTENWPRIGFEAMASGSVLIVDNRGGWRHMIEHGKTGWLCNSPEDFIQYASCMAHESELRREISLAARERGRLLGGLDVSVASWASVFNTVAQLPE